MIDEKLEDTYLTCMYCKQVVEWKKHNMIFKNGAKRIKGTCPLCGYTKYLPDLLPVEERIFNFGKHKGKNITQVPKDYLLWCINNDVIGGGMKIAAKYYLNENK